MDDSKKEPRTPVKGPGRGRGAAKPSGPAASATTTEAAPTSPLRRPPPPPPPTQSPGSPVGRSARSKAFQAKLLARSSAKAPTAADDDAQVAVASDKTETSASHPASVSGIRRDLSTLMLAPPPPTTAAAQTIPQPKPELLTKRTPLPAAASLGSAPRPAFAPAVPPPTIASLGSAPRRAFAPAMPPPTIASLPLSSMSVPPPPPPSGDGARAKTTPSPPQKLPIMPPSDATKQLASLPTMTLPRRPGYGTSGTKIRLFSNFFPIEIPPILVHMYAVTIDPEDAYPKALNRAILAHAVKEHKTVFGDQHPAYDGMKSLYLRVKLALTPDMKFKIELPRGPSGGRDRFFAVRLEHVGVLDWTNPDASNADRTVPMDVIQSLDVVLRHTLSTQADDFTSVGRSLFYRPTRPEEKMIIEGGLELWSGHFQSARQTNFKGGWKIMLNVDTSASAFHKAQPVTDLLKEMLRLPGLNSKTTLTDAQRIKFTRHIKTLKIETTHVGKTIHKKVIDVTKRPSVAVTFPLDKHDGSDVVETSVAQYFDVRYDIKLKYPQLPCLHVGSPKGNNFLPLEVCTIVPGQRCLKELTDIQKASMIKLTARPANSRRDEIQKVFRKHEFDKDPMCKEFEVKVSPEMARITGRVLSPPAIQYSGEQKVLPRQGVWDMRGKKFITGIEITKWAIISYASEAEVKLDALKRFIDELKRIGTSVGMPIKGHPALSTNEIYKKNPKGVVIEDLFRSLREREIELLIVVLPNQDGEPYNSIKRAGDVNVGLRTQCILSKNVNKASPQTLGQLVLKMNMKMGGVNMRIAKTEIRSKVFDNPVIFLGADVTHTMRRDGLIPSICAITGSMDPMAAKYAVKIDVQKANQEPIMNMKVMVKALLMEFYNRNKNVKPTKIIMFRDGVSEGQFNEVLIHEYRAIQEACKELQSEEYQPGVTFVAVQKRHHTRLFPADKKDEVGKGFNVPPGTTVDSDILHPREFDFYQVAHQGIQGTSRPCHYRTLWDDNNLSADELQSLTFQICHTYARCTRSVSIPTPTYYAHLVAFRARKYLNLEGSLPSGSITDGKQHQSALKDPDYKVFKKMVQVHEDMVNRMFFI